MQRVYYLREDQRLVFNPANGNYMQMRGKPVICLISDRNKDTGTIKYGYSILSPLEDIANYSKSEGRVEAQRKLTEIPQVVESKATTGHEINRSIIQHFSDTIGKKNGQVKKLSRRWLKVSLAKSRAAVKKEEEKKEEEK